MKQVFAFLYILTLGFTSLGAADYDQSIEEEAYAFSIKHPGDWVVQTPGATEDGGFLFLLASPGHEIMLSGHVLAPEQEFDLDEEQGQILGFKEDPDVAEVYQRMENLDVGDHGEVPAAVFKYWTGTGELIEYIFILSDGKRLVGFSIMLPGEDNRELLEEALEVVKTFRFQ